MSSSISLKSRVIFVYKNLLVAAKDYPTTANTSYSQLRKRIHDSFMKNKDLKNESEIVRAIEQAEFVFKEVEALIYLAKYRDLKRKYYHNDDDNSNDQQKLLQQGPTNLVQEYLKT